ncbi:phosphotransferase family protein [Desertibacillus haloalkaliphilus]|uniref:phosphotransferase family protein n=1 Tax=Desertibacillus haloalkaliphilus TaxID=1328930 RepID=UPI001C271DF2|nr:phosphotransferase family protein [Desertibacillus haloalkaliphilus]MBU8906260.1 phosphotransferase family protein [Desertibacillus haloalkaliphilus]
MEQYKETIDVRQGEGFDKSALKDYLKENLNGVPSDTLEVRQFPTGVSNLTYLIQCGEWEAVMRRPPAGPLPPKAHDMKRESEFLKRLYPAYQLVPKPYIYCDDESVIGVPFYIMERKKGVVVADTFPPGYTVTDELCKRISNVAVDALASLHQVDYKKVDLSSFGHPEGFLKRQVHSWIKRYERTKTDDVPYVDQLASWFVNNIPESPDATVIHNDYKLNNMLLSKDLSNIEAVLDWEIATIADPLFDLAGALGYWLEEGDPDVLKESLPTVTVMPGFIKRRDFLHRYSLKTGRDIPPLQFYLAFTYFKLAVVLQQIYYRWKKGQTNDERFSTFHIRVKHLMAHAFEVSQKDTI